VIYAHVRPRNEMRSYVSYAHFVKRMPPYEKMQVPLPFLRR
jgi:hypothetical protein